MTGQAASTRSIPFPPLGKETAHVEIKPTESESAPLTPEHPAIVLWGQMLHDHKVLKEQLAHLPNAGHDYHGTLRVILGHSISLGERTRALLKMLDEKGHF